MCWWLRLGPKRLGNLSLSINVFTNMTVSMTESRLQLSMCFCACVFVCETNTVHHSYITQWRLVSFSWLKFRNFCTDSFLHRFYLSIFVSFCCLTLPFVFPSLHDAFLFPAPPPTLPPFLCLIIQSLLILPTDGPVQWGPLATLPVPLIFIHRQQKRGHASSLHSTCSYTPVHSCVIELLCGAWKHLHMRLYIY